MRPDTLFAYDGNPEDEQPYYGSFRIEEGAIVKFVCPSRRAAPVGLLTDEKFKVKWKLNTYWSVSNSGSDYIELFGVGDTFEVDDKIEMYQSNGLGFNGRKGKRLQTLTYTARMEDNGKYLTCIYEDQDYLDSLNTARDDVYDASVRLWVFRK